MQKVAHVWSSPWQTGYEYIRLSLGQSRPTGGTCDHHHSIHDPHWLSAFCKNSFLLAPTTWSRRVHFSGISGPLQRLERVWGSKWPFVMPLFVPVVHMQWSQIGGWTARPKTNYILVKVEISDSDKANQGGRSIGSYNAIICYSQWTTFSCSFYEVGSCQGQPRSYWPTAK